MIMAFKLPLVKPRTTVDGTGLPVYDFSKLFNKEEIGKGVYGAVFTAGSRGGGYSQKNWVGVCGPLPKTLTLFMTNICDFPYPIYDLTKNLIPYL